MTDTPSVELLDFFSMEKDTIANVCYGSNNSASRLHPSIDRRRSFSGVQSVISKINPQLLKSVIASSATYSVPCPRDALPPPLPVYAPVHQPRNGGGETDDGETAPLTIFYNGAVMVFDVPPHKAEGILKLAVSGSGSVRINRPDIAAVVPPGDHRDLLCTLTGDLPMARRISLQRFLEKRKERLTSASPCYRDNRKTE